jgi:hypothetical protein
VLGTGVLRFRGRFAFREDENADVLARTVGKRTGAADHLVGLAGIHSHAEGEGDGLIEFRSREFLHQRYRVFDRVDADIVDKRGSRLVSFASFFGHVLDAVRAGVSSPSCGCSGCLKKNQSTISRPI